MKAILKRFIFSILTLFLALSFSFFLIHLVPGDPTDIILGDKADNLDRAQLREKLGLNEKLSTQYIHFLINTLKGDLSSSLYSEKPVITELKSALPATFQLAVSALLLSMLLGIPLAILATLKKGLLDKGLSFFSLLGMSLPVFCTAPFLIWFFAIKLSLLPVSERGPELKYFILPSLSLAIPLGAILFKMSKSALLETLQKDYIRTAYAKGLSFWQVGLKHALKNASIPIVTILGLQSGALLTGTVIVESIFDWPGIGLLLLESIQKRDYPLVQGGVLLIAVIYILVNFIVDLIYLLLHPKMSLQ